MVYKFLLASSAIQNGCLGPRQRSRVIRGRRSAAEVRREEKFSFSRSRERGGVLFLCAHSGNRHQVTRASPNSFPKSVKLPTL